MIENSDDDFKSVEVKNSKNLDHLGKPNYRQHSSRYFRERQINDRDENVANWKVCSSYKQKHKLVLVRVSSWTQFLSDSIYKAQ